MGISSLGAGSSVLTQDVIDQLRAADESKFVTPIDRKVTAENDKTSAFDVLDAHMDNVYESLKSLNEYGVFESRTTSVSDESIVGITAKDSSDIQDFTLDIEQLATKEIEQSGSFSSKTDKIADGSGVMELNVGDLSFDINYDATTTLEGLKELINKTAGDSVNATIVQVNDNDYRLLFNAVDSGVGSEISIKDTGTKNDNKNDNKIDDILDNIFGGKDDNHHKGNLKRALTSGMSNVQTAQDAKFTFNGLDITRSSNSVDDLLSGVTLTLKDTGRVDASVQQNRENIESKITNFIDKYNTAMYQLSEDTKSSQDADERGAFSSDSTIKNMRTSLTNIISTVGGGGTGLSDYGINVDEDGRLSVDSEVLDKQLDKNAGDVQAFFTGGTMTGADGEDKKVEGIFTELETEFAKYSKYNTILDQYKESIDTRMTSLSEQREKAIARLDSTYDIMAKRFASYDAIINRYNQASSMFTEMINAEANN